MARKAKVLTDKELRERAEALEHYKQKSRGKYPEIEEIVDSHGQKKRIRGDR